ncbi:MAG: nicotinate phosphoribosyltransferase [Anaerolineales bacterium]|nr:nicotinate phosphoribosyltransferase [Anaerolineales bacterium]
MNKYNKRISEGILFTDLYQITMAQLYFSEGLHEKPALFDYFFRSNPDYGIHEAGYCVNAGLEWLADWMQSARFGEEEINYLRSLKGRSGSHLFGKEFLSWLKEEGDFSCLSLSAVPEGRVIHPNTPVSIIKGPLAMGQILETSLLNHLNFQTLIATKASRIREISRGQMVLEFGLRRAQGLAANAGTRAALIGGADFSSNVGISKVLGYPPKGTHSHSMVQVFMASGMTELDAFRAYANLYPDDCLLLVDTINTLDSGVPNAITVFEELKRNGHTPMGVRLDSGDLAHLSVKVARMLNEAGFPDVIITLSNDLDELTIWQIISQIQDEAPRYGLEADHVIKRLAYGVGTRLITSGSRPALDGVCKLVAVCNQKSWTPAIKISESPVKTLNPGFKNLWRIYDEQGKATADLVTLEEEVPGDMDQIILRHPTDHGKYRKLGREGFSRVEPLLVIVFQNGKLVYDFPTIDQIREQRISDIDKLHSGVNRIIEPHIYHVSLSQKLWELKQNMVSEATIDISPPN